MIDWTNTGAQAAQILSDYLRIRSVNPPGNELEAAEFLDGLLQERGIESTLYHPGPDRANLVARLRGNGSRQPVLLYHHMDVVEANTDQWTVDPFGGDIREGFVYGRGAIDMKGMGVMQLLALDLLQRTVPDRSRDIILLAAADEEKGGRAGVQWMIENHWDAIATEFVWDEGGFGLEDLFGPLPVFTTAVAEKHDLWVRLIVRGEPGHSGMPVETNAVTSLRRALDRVMETNARWEVHPVTRRMFAEIGRGTGFPQALLLRNLGNPLVFRLLRKKLTANPQIAAMLRDTVSITVLQAGGKENVTPDRAEAVLDIRLLPGRDPHAFLDDLRKRIDDDAVELAIVQFPQESSISSTGSDFYRTLKQVVEELVPGSRTVPMLTPGTTDSCFFRRKGVSSYGLFPAVISPDELEGFHGHDERISLENLQLGTQIMYEVLKRLCM